MRDIPGVENAVAFAGFSGATFTNASNAGAIFAAFADFDGAERARPAVGRRAHRPAIVRTLQAIQEAFIIAIPPPPVRGLGNAGGFKMQLQDRDWADVTRMLAARQRDHGPGRARPGP